ncbi:TPA: DivIVA domain-containing protein [bacterium]|jgi:DivIVA domain-containing protein|nr:DivIVA domain-containing protein [bacterium]
MMLSNLKLTPNIILEKEFSVQTRGYNADEVDEFLDLIIKDYENMRNYIENLELNLRAAENNILMLKNKINDLELELEVAKTKERRVPSVEQSVSNLDLLKRISQLEAMIYQQKMKEEELKNNK